MTERIFTPAIMYTLKNGIKSQPIDKHVWLIQHIDEHIRFLPIRQSNHDIKENRLAFTTKYYLWNIRPCSKKSDASSISSILFDIQTVVTEYSE